MDYPKQKISTEYPVPRIGRVDFESAEIGGIKISNWDKLSPALKTELRMVEYIEFDEVLLHDTGAVGLARVDNGVCALLNGHPSFWEKNGMEDVLGNVENVFVEENFLYGDIKIPDVNKASELIKALESGLRMPTSIGYTNHAGRLSYEAERFKIEVENWELRHLAVVPEGADNSTSLGKREKSAHSFFIRSSSPPKKNRKKNNEKEKKEEECGINELSFSQAAERKIINQPEEKPMDKQSSGEVAAESATETIRNFAEPKKERGEIENLTDIHEFLDGFCERDFVKSRKDKIGGAIAEAYGKAPDVSLSERIKIITEAINVEQGREDIADGFRGGFAQELSRKEREVYSYSKAIMMGGGKLKKDGLEWEVSQEIEKSRPGALTEKAGAIFTSMSLLRQDPREQIRTSLTMGTAASVGNFVQESVLADQFAPPHRKMDVLTMLGATMLTGLRTKGAIPVQATEAASGWTAEAAARAESNLTGAKRSLEPHRLTTLQSASYELMATEGNLDTENIMRQSAYQSMMDAVNASAIAGASSGNDPTGVINTTGINTLTASTNGDVVNWSDLVALWRLLAEDDVSTSMGWRLLANPLVFARFMSVRKDASKASAGNSYTSGTLYLDYIVPRVGTHGMFTDISGIEGLSSNHVPKGITRGSTTTTSPIVMGYWPDLVCATWDSVQVVVDPFSSAEDGIVRLIMTSLHDVAIKRPTSFAVNPNAIHD